MSENTPPFTVSSKSINLVAEICTRLVSIGTYGESIPPRLRRENRIKSIQSSLAIENNNLTLDEVTDVVDGKRVVGNARDILEVKNAFECYELLNGLNPCELKDLLRIHRLMMKGLQTDAGQLRSVRVGVFAGKTLIHSAPPPELVPGLISDLMSWLESSEDHPLIKSSVFHYEFERIHPFTDGNGRTGRFWHTLILSKWHEEFSWIPIETVVRERQNEYYSALAESNKRNNSEPFIDFMLESILMTVNGMIAPHATDEPGLSDTEAKVLGMIRIGTFGNIDNASNALGVSERTVIRALDSLREKNLIVREGSRKSGVWRAL